MSDKTKNSKTKITFLFLKHILLFLKQHFSIFEKYTSIFETTLFYFENCTLLLTFSLQKNSDFLSMLNSTTDKKETDTKEQQNRQTIDRDP